MSELDMHKLLTSSLSELGAVPVRVEESGDLVPLVASPDWLEGLKPLTLDNFPVLECVVDDFEPFWAGAEGAEAESFGPWEQVGENGEPVALEARPIQSSEGRVVLLRMLGEHYEEMAQTLQKARDNLLVHEALEKEIKKKEFLLHTIVHDLAGPLTSIKGAFHILSRQNLAREQMDKLLEIGVRQTEKQHSMIGEILDVFSAEMGSLDKLAVDSVAYPLQVAGRLKEALGSAFQSKGVNLVVEGDDTSVVGDEAKLERVVSNLVENALRHVPRGSTVRVDVKNEEESTLVEVSDDGSGVPEEFVGQLFRKLSQGADGKGKAGLGLYFCKLTVEAWGGEIGYRSSDQGGACFWFRLPNKAP